MDDYWGQSSLFVRHLIDYELFGWLAVYIMYSKTGSEEVIEKVNWITINNHEWREEKWAMKTFFFHFIQNKSLERFIISFEYL